MSPIFRHRHDRRRRLVGDGDEYTIDEERLDEVELEVVAARDEPPVDVQGEPWGWTKGPPYPKGWREDGQYGPDQGLDA